MKNKTLMREKNLTATGILILFMVILFTSEYFWISHLIEERSFLRMQEGVETVIEEISQKMNRDSRILNATANILANADNFDLGTMQRTMTTVSPMLETMYMEILLPDDTIIATDGSFLPNRGEISFAKEMPLGEHVSNRNVSLLDGNTYVLRHYVPIVKDGETVAMLFGVTNLSKLPSVLNIDHIYNARANVYIIDTENGDYIMDTWREQLVNLKDLTDVETRDGSDWLEKMQELMQLKSGHVEYRSLSTGKWDHLYYAPANINRWAIAVSVPEEEAFANVFAIRRVCLIIGSLAGIVVILYYLWMRKNAIDAINKAVETAVL